MIQTNPASSIPPAASLNGMPMARSAKPSPLKSPPARKTPPLAGLADILVPELVAGHGQPGG
jgi:hypothetical protein